MADVTNFSLGDRQVWIKDQTARDAAGTAQNIANRAQNTAIQAQNTANQAQQSAASANTAAQNATTAAQNAQQTASNALDHTENLIPLRTLNNKKIAFIGDSWGVSSGDAYTTVMATELNMEELNYCEAGAGFLRPGNSGNTFTTLETNLKNSSQIPDIVCVLGGYNDINNGYDINAIYNAANSLLQKIRKDFPNAQILFGGANCACYGFNGKFAGLYYQLKRCLAFTANVNNATEWIYSMAGYSQYFLEDHLHPNQTGHKFIAHCLESALLGSTWVYGCNVSYAENPSLFTQFTSSGVFRLWQDGGMVRLQMPTLTANQDLTGALIKSDYTIQNPYRPNMYVARKVFNGITAQNLVLIVNPSGKIFIQNLPSTTKIQTGSVIYPQFIEWPFCSSNT